MAHRQAGKKTHQPKAAIVLGSFLCLVFSSGSAIAGGSGEKVSIERFAADGDDYTLIVIPETTNVPDDYMSACARFEVRGTFGRLRGDLPWQRRPGLTREEHRKALAYLQHAFETKQPVYLGWIGQGFARVDDLESCVVKSRALALLDDPKHRTWVTSFHDKF